MKPAAQQLVILTGPSCVGKSPLRRALFQYHPEIANQLSLVTLFTSRDPRPGEQDGEQYYFRTREEILDLKQQQGFLVMDVRADLQAVNMDSILELIHQNRPVLYEGNPFIADDLMEFAVEHEIPHCALFLSPLNRMEIEQFLANHTHVELERCITEYMKHKLLIRASSYHSQIEHQQLEHIQLRAASAYKELMMAPGFGAVLPNHDGEGSDHWELFGYPIGDAGKALQAFIDFIMIGHSERIENWDASLFSS